jgi:3-dehydroquinate synthase
VSGYAVGLGDRAYEVLVAPGLIDRAGELIAPLMTGARAAVVTDTTVADLYAARLGASLGKAGVTSEVIAVSPGEAVKSFAGLEDLLVRLLDLELDRGDFIVALGGGVVGDLAGFAAAIYKRGIDFVQIPTTLLAQVDSSVGGKTAIDAPQGKNLIGAFHQPRLVLGDLDTLVSLPAREMRCGYAEIIKYGLLGDAGFFAWLEANGASVLDRDPLALAHAIGRSIEMKAEIVAEDEREHGRRALLNLGHTFGHALEGALGFSDALLHGEAVALGSALAFRFAAAGGLCPSDDSARARGAIATAGLPTQLADIAGSPALSAGDLVGRMAQDKKARAGRITLILPRRIGETFVDANVDVGHLTTFLIEEGARP